MTVLNKTHAKSHPSWCDHFLSRQLGLKVALAGKANTAFRRCHVRLTVACGLGSTAFVSAALLAAHLAFIAAESCARRSGERFSFLFALLAAGFLASAISAAAARAADFLAAFKVFAASAASSLRFRLANFCGPSRRRFSSRLIFFLKSFIFMMCVPAAMPLLLKGASAQRTCSTTAPPASASLPFVLRVRY